MPGIASVVTSSDLPTRTDVAIIGGGVIGVSTAMELAERGVSVAVLEKGVIAGEQSSRNWGWCRQMGRDPREIPLVLESLRLWRGMNARIGTEAGYRQCGIMYLAESEKELAGYTRWRDEHAAPHQLKTRMIGPQAIAELQPGFATPWKGALYSPEDGRAEPFISVPAMARYAMTQGVHIVQGCAVRGVETSAGRISGVVTEKGTIACTQAVVAGGAWSRRFLHNLGIPFPQLTVISSVMRTEPIDTGSDITSSGGRFAIRKRLDGGYTIAHNHMSVADITPDSFRLFFQFLPALKQDWAGIRLRFGKAFLDAAKLKRTWRMDESSPFEQVRVLDPEPVSFVLEDAAAGVKASLPIFSNMKIAERWAGLIDTTPDVVPVISALPKIEGLFLASGFSGHGFGIGPGAGKLMAEIMTGSRTCVDPEPFRYSRYFDGSRPRPVAAT
jgi:glycine/D-amino acid oxidase-like deaminating enzyme